MERLNRLLLTYVVAIVVLNVFALVFLMARVPLVGRLAVLLGTWVLNLLGDSFMGPAMRRYSRGLTANHGH